MRNRHQTGPSYSKVDYRPDEHTDGYTSAGSCNTKNTCDCESCKQGTHNFRQYGQHCNSHDGGCHYGC